MTEIQLFTKPTAVEKPGNINVKIITLWAFGLIFSFASGWFLKNFFSSNQLGDAVIGTSIFVLFVIISLLQAMFVSDAGASAFIVFLESIVMVLPFIPKSLMILGLIPVMFLIFYIGNSNCRKSIANSLKVDFWNASKSFLPKGIVAFSVLIGVLLPFYFISGEQKSFPLSPAIFDYAVSSGDFIIKRFFPSFNPTSSIESMAMTTAAEKLNMVPNAKLLSEDAKKKFMDEFVTGLYAQISAYVGAPINPKLTVAGMFYDIAINKFNSLPDKSRNMIYSIGGLLLFFSIEAVSVPIRFVISILAYILFEILIALGFAQISIEQTSREIIIT